jgi:hypothetical protein
MSETRTCEACDKLADGLKLQATATLIVAGVERHMCGHHRRVLPVDLWPMCPDGWGFDEKRGFVGCWVPSALTGNAAYRNNHD